MNKQLLFANLVYVGAVFERGRDMRSALICPVRTAEIKKHVPNMMEMVAHIMSKAITGNETESLRVFLTLHFSLANDDLSTQIADWLKTSCDQLESVDISDEQRRIDELILIMLRDIHDMLEKPLPVFRYKTIAAIFRALHNLPRVHMTHRLFGIANISLISASEALEYSMLYLDEKRRESYLAQCGIAANYHELSC